ncbi:MAG: cell wall hydrolase [Peptococcaceae bacterium]|jgi:N-acetylmuramoyl-L-alanine amidase|nr:cell wall hydrolase [Peptococcaceae bacterium]
MENYKGLVWLGVLVLFLGQAVPARAATEVSLAGGEVQLTYTVQPGDTLSGIAQAYGVDLDKLIAANRLDSDLIHPGDLLLVPGHFEPVPAFVSRGEVGRSDLMLLARLIYAEARGEPFSGQVAVGAVIINRMASPLFPKSIRAVIMQHSGGSYQFQPVADGAIDLTPDASAIRAAISALNGRDPSHGALYFYNPVQAQDPWIRTLPVITRIGNHLFATERSAAPTFFPEGVTAGLPA